MTGFRLGEAGLSIQSKHPSGHKVCQQLGAHVLLDGEERKGHRDVQFVDLVGAYGRMNVEGQGFPRPPNVHALQGGSDACKAGQCRRIGDPGYANHRAGFGTQLHFDPW